MNFKEFIASNFVNLWIREPYIRIYVRKSYRHLGGKNLIPCFDIGNVEVSERHRGKKVFTRFLRRVEQHAKETGRAVFVESVMEPRLADFLKRFGYRVDPRTEETLAPSFWKNPT